MVDAVLPTPESILRMIADASPALWFPSEFADANNLPRDPLDGLLNGLRMSGLIDIADWQKGRGQGYRLTPAGREILQQPALLSRLNGGATIRVIERAPEPTVLRPRTKSGASTAFERGEAVRHDLRKAFSPAVSRWLLFLNVAVFGISLLLAVMREVPLNDFLYRSDTSILIDTGAVSGVFLVQGEWWRLLTCCFVHIGLLHLFVNMYSLLAMGPLGERLWGKLPFSVLYLIAGVGGSWAAMIVKPDVLLAGASGAIWGIMTSIIAWALLHREHLGPQVVRTVLNRMVPVLVLNVLISMAPGISAAGHFGGGAFGFLTSILLTWQRFGSPRQRALAVALLAALPGLFVMTLLVAMQRGDAWESIRQKAGDREQVRILRQFDERFTTPVRNLNQELFNIVDRRAQPLLKLPFDHRDAAKVNAVRAELTGVQQRITAQLQQIETELGNINERTVVGKEFGVVLAGFLTAQHDYAKLIEEQLTQEKPDDPKIMQQYRRGLEQLDELLSGWDR